ncbi:MAG: hypothetical protein IPM29_05915 [Planctomycetes bacterium]|nr:hypothetical protein [Planctomycetota bacterium]
MKQLLVAITSLVATVTAVPAQNDMIGVSWTGSVYGIDSTTGAGTLIGTTGLGTGANSMAIDGSGTVYIHQRSTGLATVDPATGAATIVCRLTALDVRGLAYSPTGVLYAVVDGGSADSLFTIDVATCSASLVGATGLVSLQGLTFLGNTLYGWDVSRSTTQPGLGLVTIDTTTGVATDVNPTVGGANHQFLTSDGAGNLLAGNNALYRIDVSTGVETLIGSGGYTDLRGADRLAGSGVTYGVGCPTSTGAVPTLFASATSPGTLNVQIGSGPAGAAAALAFGAGRTAFPIGIGCTLLTAPAISITVGLDPSGRFALSTPVSAGFTGIVLNTQAFVLDPAAPSGIGIAASAGFEFTIG